MGNLRAAGAIGMLVAVTGGCGFDRAPLSPPTQDAATGIQGSGQTTGGSPSGVGGTGSGAGRSDAGARDAGRAGHMDAGRRDAGANDAGKADASTPACAPDGRERACGSDVGACVAGKQRCKDGAWGACGGGVTPANELCDGLDNDCDDATDEGCPCGAGEMRSCGSDIGACVLGVQACVNGNWGGCQGDVEPATESCATPLDEDCDGTANEACACQDGATQACGSDVGECARGVATCVAGGWGACVGGTAAHNETCDSEDDDCDGATDEGCACTGGASRPCGTDVGECDAGTQTCLAGAWGPCQGGSPPTDETCDTQDDDCDGTADEGGNACGGVCTLAPAVGVACDGADGDECDDDAYACNGANAVQCPSGATETEVCNGQDDDCIAGCDDTFACCKGATRACASACATQGIETCAEDCAWGACVPPAETCNGGDDDCDGAADEGFGLCAVCCDATGDADKCNDDQMTCNGCQDVGGSVVESCNGSDDDCDGPSDEGFGLCTTCCDASGDADECDDDQITCNGCEDVGGDVVETCNGTDDDCDGPSDEGFGLCTTCCDAADDADKCDDDRVTCNGCQDVGGAIVETCNGADDDCDGPSDEGFGLCTTCCDAVGDADKCNDDEVTCNGCQDVGGDVAETCNGLDDDCDGPVDEGFGLCTTCCDSILDADLCNDDRVTCAGCEDVDGDVVEACNGIDDDCDGVTDEGFGLCTACCDAVADADQCDDDQVTCSGCQDVAGDVVEACNGADDDCDGPTDEDFGLCTTCCDAAGDTDQCNDDQVTCNGCQDVGGSIAETCNDADDDCDGPIDEDFGLCSGCCDSPDDADQCDDDDFTCAGCVEVGGAVIEVCNGMDDDCDGPSDEGFPPQPLIPPGLTLFFDSACPSGWTAMAGQAGLFAMGHDNAMPYAETGGAVHAHSMAHSHTTSTDGYSVHQHNVTSIAATTGTAQAGVQACDRTLPTACACGQCDQPVGAHSHSLPAGGILSGLNGGGDHAHTVTGSPSTGPALDLPAWRETNFCVKDGVQLTAIVPTAAIAMFRQNCAPGWTEDESFRDRFLRDSDGDFVYDEMGGSDSHGHSGAHNHGGVTNSADGAHSHTSGGTTGNALATHNRFYSLSAAAGSHNHAVAPYGSVPHTHSVTTEFPSVTSDLALPLYREMIFCKATGPACNATSQGMVGAFDWSCPAGWAELVTYRDRLVRGHDGDASLEETGGTATHTHTVGGHGLVITTSASHTHAFTTTPLTWPPVFPELVLSGACSTCYTYATHGHTHGGSMSSAGTHSHTVTAGADFVTATAPNAPPWREHVLCEKQ